MAHSKEDAQEVIDFAKSLGLSDRDLSVAWRVAESVWDFSDALVDGLLIGGNVDDSLAVHQAALALATKLCAVATKDVGGIR